MTMTMTMMSKTLASAAKRLWLLLLAGSLATVCCAQTATGAGPSTSAGTTVADASKPAADAAKPSDAAKPAETPHFQSRTTRYRIQAGDTFDLTFDLSPEFNQTALAVQPDGFVTLRGVGEMKVAGETVPELTTTIKVAYGKFLNNPSITVVLKEFEKPYFVADGQVAKPGKYEMHGNMTVTQAIAVAGGFQSAAKHSQVVLFRRVDDQWTEAKLINVKKMEKDRDLKEDPFLHSGDMLFVPKNTLSKIDRIIPNMSMGTYMPLAIP